MQEMQPKRPPKRSTWGLGVTTDVRTLEDKRGTEVQLGNGKWIVLRLVVCTAFIVKRGTHLQVIFHGL